MTAPDLTQQDPSPAAAKLPEVSYRFARRPKWIVWHIIAITVVVSFTALGFWQLRKLDQRRHDNAVTLARNQVEPAPVGDVMNPSSSPEVVSGLTFRRVTVAGEYQVADEVIVRNHTNGGAPGFWVLTPVRMADGSGVIVNRGWIPLQLGDPGDPSKYAAPSGRVTVTGVIHESQVREGMGIADPATGRLGTLSRVDVARLGQQVSYRLLPAYVDLVASNPRPALSYPSPIPPQELDDGPHLNYAGQWFIFTALTLITYPLLLRRTAQRHAMFPPDDNGWYT